MKKINLLCLLGLFSLMALAQVPAGYYSVAEGKQGDALRLALQDAIDNHTVVSYDALRYLYEYSDTENAAGSTIIDIYSTCGFPYTTSFCAGGCGGGFNREHSVPKSWFNEATPMYSDAFHLYPTSCYVNSYRGNYALGVCANGTKCTTNSMTEALGRRGNCTYPGYSGVVYEPDDEYKGDLARTYFYMATRYANACSSWSGGMFGSDNNGFQTWAINMLLEWHRQDPVSTKEKIRNEAIYGNSTYNKGSYKQNNRNPFIDYPCLAEYIWGDSTTKSVDFSKLVSSYDASFTDQGCPCETPGAPIVNTPTYTEGLTAGGNIASAGDAAITENGIEWSNTSGFSNGAGTKIVANPTATTTGAFTVDISSLTTPGTYYFKAYATNSIGTSYSVQSSFTIIDPAQVGLGPNLVMGTLVTNDIAFGESNSKELFIKISNVTSDITITLTNNNGNYKFATTDTTIITLTAAEATAGKRITLTRDGGNNGATLTISGNGVNKVHNIKGN